MKTLSNQRGGILIRLFLLLFFIAAGALGWFYWKHRRMPTLRELKKNAAVRDVKSLAKEVVGNQNETGPVTKDSRALCAWVQSNARDALVKQGLTEADVLKSVNAERQKDGVRWIEQTLEVHWPSKLHPAAFRQDIERLAKSKGLSMLRDEKTPDQWTMEVGVKERIFERLILHRGAGKTSSVLSPVENASAPAAADNAGAVRLSRTVPSGTGAVAFVIDDLGYNVAPMDGFLKLDIPITFAVLPGERHSADLARRAHSAKREVILHLPLEPEDVKDNNPGSHAIFRRMDSAQVRQKFEQDLASVPFAVGVSNHMGSAFTEDEKAMARLMPELKRAKVFFFDSRTTPRTAGKAVAQRFKVPVAENKLFLDSQDSEEAINHQLKTVEHWALEGKRVAVIGHFQRKHLVSALAREIPLWRAKGIRFETLSAMIRENSKTGV